MFTRHFSCSFPFHSLSLSFLSLFHSLARSLTEVGRLFILESFPPSSFRCTHKETFSRLFLLFLMRWKIQIASSYSAPHTHTHSESNYGKLNGNYCGWCDDDDFSLSLSFHLSRSLSFSPSLSHFPFLKRKRSFHSRNYGFI